jgi:hypothetical protein
MDKKNNSKNYQSINLQWQVRYESPAARLIGSLQNKYFLCKTSVVENFTAGIKSILQG